MASYPRPLPAPSCCLLFLVLSTLWPIGANQGSELRHPTAQPLPAPPQYLESAALKQWSRRLQRHRYKLSKQGILVESLDGKKILAELNPDTPLNPASVMKLATSLTALARLGPDYRFATRIYGDTPTNQEKRRLSGNLYLVSDGNPLFGRAEVYRLARSLIRRGALHRVTGDLIVVGPFSVNSSNNPRFPVRYLARSFRRAGIRIQGKTRSVSEVDLSDPSIVQFLSHTSANLRDILWEQNAFSVNDIADRLGRSLGGAGAIRDYLIEKFGIHPSDIHVDKPSGLGYNRMTARAAIQVLHGLHSTLQHHDMKLQDVVPVAGVDRGTLRWRFRRSKYRGGLLGKTGTNSSKDGGVSALAGLAMTRAHGPVFYAILNTGGSVMAYRRWQDRFLNKLIEESGGMSRRLDTHPKSNRFQASSSWTPSPYWQGLARVPVYRRKTRKGAKKPIKEANTDELDPKLPCLFPIFELNSLGRPPGDPRSVGRTCESNPQTSQERRADRPPAAGRAGRRSEEDRRPGEGRGVEPGAGETPGTRSRDRGQVLAKTEGESVLSRCGGRRD